MKFKRIYIEITNKCNMHCSFCPTHKRENRFMSVSEFKNILRQIKPYSDYLYLHVKGEPLLHPDLPEMLDVCNEYGFYVNLTTNGTLLGENSPMLYSKKAIRQVNISLHSLESKGLIEKYLDSTIRFAKGNHSAITAFRLWNYQAGKENDNANLVFINKIRSAFNSDFDASNINQRGVKVAANVYLNSDYQFQWPSLNAPYIGESGMCYGLRQQIAILVDGTVVPCCLDGDGVINLGNVFTQDFNDIIVSKQAQKIIKGFEENLAIHEMCQRCGYRKKFIKCD